MTQVASPSSRDSFREDGLHWEDGWHFDVDDLRLAGVDISDDQHDLLLPFSDGELVVVALPLPAPDALFIGADMATAAPLEVRNGPREPLRRATAPFLAEVRWDAAEALEERVGPFWRRFPSLPVQIIYPDVDFWPTDYADDEYRFVRIWNARTCTADLSNDMLFFGSSLSAGWNAYTKLGLFWATVFNLIDDCELAISYEGVGPSHHQHYEVPVPHALFDIKCGNGEEIFNRLEHELFISGHRGSDVKAFLLPEMDIDLSIAWTALERAARAAGRQAVQVAPSMAATLLHDEREGGCPWE